MISFSLKTSFFPDTNPVQLTSEHAGTQNFKSVARIYMLPEKFGA